MIPNHIQAVVFDAVGTLIHVEPSFDRIYAEVGRRFGSQLDDAAVRTRFLAAFAQQDQIDRANDWHTDEAREQERWRNIVAAVFDDVVDAEACFDTLFQTFGTMAVWRADADAEAVLRYCTSRGLRVSLASNFDRRLRDVIAVVPGHESFAFLHISSEIGRRKPSPDFFTHVARDLDLPPEQILFVGDDRTNDYDPAIAIGMHARLIDARRQHLALGSNRIDRLGGLFQEG